MHKLWSFDPFVSLYLAFVICSLHITDYMQESSFCEAHHLFSQLQGVKSHQETTRGSHYCPFIGPHAQHANTSKALHLDAGAGKEHARWIPVTSMGPALCTSSRLWNAIHSEHYHTKTPSWNAVMAEICLKISGGDLTMTWKLWSSSPNFLYIWHFP